MNNGVFWDVTLVRTDVLEELGASIRVTRLGELGTTLAVTCNRGMLQRNTFKKQSALKSVVIIAKVQICAPGHLNTASENAHRRS
jgi:hypothetical protein